MLEIKGKLVTLREFTDKELYDPKYFQWLRDYSNIRNLYRIEYLKSLKFNKIEDYISSIVNSSNNSLFAIYEKSNDVFIGTLKVGHIDWRSGIGDLGIMIGDKHFKGKGLAKESVRLGCEYAFKWLGLRRITGGTFEDNIPMIKCFTSTGFILEGRKRKELLVDGEYQDHMLFGILKDEFYSILNTETEERDK